MRNLKKILALVLALVMSLSLMATAGAKDFTDSSDIEATGYQTAVDVLAELEVVRGYENGSFQPNGDITRAEVAAIIYRIATKDVKDTQQGIYTSWNKFNDVKDGAWYAGYVNYCANAEIVKGKTATTFDPDARITGYQVLAMILRTMGYGKNGEFEGDNWAINTAAKAKQIGIIDNIIEQKLGSNATRAMVAEILFNALLTSTVEYNPITGYVPTGKTLGQTQFGLETVTGVVTANEYADLYGASPLPAGKTRLVNDEKTYRLDYATKLTDIGEKHHAYVVNGTKVLSMEKTGNTVWENEGKAANIGSAGNFAKATGLSRGGESYVNFGGDGDAYTALIRIQYWIDTDEDGVFNKDNDEVGKFALESKLDSDDYYTLKGIFANDNKMDGWVVVGTNDLEEENDISNTMTWAEFCDKYLEEATTRTGVTGADNGEWLKVIDNDGDGVADYVFLTTFVMTTVIDYNKRDDVYTVEYTNQQVAGKPVDRDYKGAVTTPSTRLEIDAGDISTDIEEIAEGDVILYTYIDGVYHVAAPTVETAAIDKKGIDYKNETFTCGDKTYEWSGIDYEAYNYYHDVSEAATQTNYDFYLDHFGYIRLYTESTYNQGFVLLTDGYYETDRRTDGYKAEIWNRETEDYEDVVVLNPSGSAKVFIDNGVTDGKDDEGTWTRLIEFGQVYKNSKYPTEAADPFYTNIAAVSVNEDGEYVLMPVQSASNRITYNAHELNLDKDGKGNAISAKERTIYSLNTNTRIQTTSDTVYYYVLNPGTSSEKITSWVGYNNAPSSVVLNASDKHLDHAYAVTTPSNTTAGYETAEVVVFEANGWTQTAIMAYALDQKLIGENRAFDIYGLGYDDEEAAYGPVVVSGKVTDQKTGLTKAIDLDDYAPWNLDHLIHFYTIDSNGATLNLTADGTVGIYEDYNVYAGYVTTAEKVLNRDYITVSDHDTWTKNAYSFYTDSTPTFVVTYNATAAAQDDYVWVSSSERLNRTGNVRTTFDVDESNSFSAGRASATPDKVIYVTDGRNVLYMINVTESKWYDRTAGEYKQVEALEALWTEISEDWTEDHKPAPEPELSKVSFAMKMSEGDIVEITPIGGKAQVVEYDETKVDEATGWMTVDIDVDDPEMFMFNLKMVQGTFAGVVSANGYDVKAKMISEGLYRVTAVLVDQTAAASTTPVKNIGVAYTLDGVADLIAEAKAATDPEKAQDLADELIAVLDVLVPEVEDETIGTADAEAAIIDAIADATIAANENLTEDDKDKLVEAITNADGSIEEAIEEVVVENATANAETEIEEYEADAIAALAGDDANAAATAKTAALAALKAEDLDEAAAKKAVADYKAAIDALLTAAVVEFTMAGGVTKTTSDLAYAFKNVKEGGTVTLTNDLSVAEVIVITDKEVTFDIGGNDLSVSKPLYESGGPVGLINLRGSAKMTLEGNGGSIICQPDDTYVLYLDETAECTIDVTNNTVLKGDASVAQVKGNATLYVKGGRFDRVQVDKWGYKYLLNKIDSDVATATISVSGGVFVGFNPKDVYADPSAPVNYLASANYDVTVDNSGSTPVYTVVQK